MFIKREVYKKLVDKVSFGKVVLLLGPRRVGKTTVLKHFLKDNKDRYNSMFVVGDDRFVQEALSSGDEVVLKRFLGKCDLLVVDEAQYIPNIGQNLKLIVDRFPEIAVVASGSASFELMQQVGEPLTGRKYSLNMYPVATMELVREFGSMWQERHLEDVLLYGSYPELFSLNDKKEKAEYLHELVSSYLLRDILSLEKVKNSKKLNDLLILLAFQIGNEVSVSELANNLDLNKGTVQRYLDLLEKTYVIFNLRGFSRNLRKEVSKTSRYYFYDNGVRNALLNNFNSLNLRNDVGMLWENYLVMERLKKQQYDSVFANNYFWRTYDQQEVDWVEERDGGLFGYEFKYKVNKVKVPKAWLEAYDNAEFEVVNKGNYFDFVL